MTNRRRLFTAGMLGAIACAPGPGFGIDIPGSETLLHLRSRFDSPILIDSVDQVRIGKTIWIRVRSRDGAEGFCPGNDRLAVTVELAKQLIIPFFIGKDARDLESLVDDVYTVRDQRGSVYKYAGMPFWNVVGHVEIAIFDMLGKLAGAPVNQLLGKPKRSAIPVYISQFGRDTSAEQEVANAARDLEKSGAKATKLKIGLRMANSEAQSRRDRKMIELARREFADDVTLCVDANSSYTVEEAIQMGEFLDGHGVHFMEEPVPWQDYQGTKRVTRALAKRKLQVAGGEQDSNLWQWKDMIDGRAIDIVQPDVYYNGGLVRCLRVAKMAEAAGMAFTPHSPKVLPHAAANLHLCSVVPNLGPFQEYRSYGTVRDGKVDVPTGHGLGIDVDETSIRSAKTL